MLPYLLSLVSTAMLAANAASASPQGGPVAKVMHGGGAPADAGATSVGGNGNPPSQKGGAQSPREAGTETLLEAQRQASEQAEAVLLDLEKAAFTPEPIRAKLREAREALTSRTTESLWRAAVLMGEASAQVGPEAAPRFQEGFRALLAAHALASDARTDTTETNRGPIVPFLEGTDVFWTVQRRNGDELAFPNRLEADIFPHLIAVQTFSDVMDFDEQFRRSPKGRTKEFAYSVSGTPGVRIRMLRETSAPVRTPSYMPRVNVQFLWARGLKRALEEAAPREGDTTVNWLRAFAALDRISLWEVHAIVGHHSNGQDGCITTDQTRVPLRTGPCQPENIQPVAENINRIDGSFSTNYIRVGLNYSLNRLSASTDHQALRELRLKGEFEYHPRDWVDSDIVDLYGRARLNYQAAYAARGIRGCPRRLEGSYSGVLNPGVVETVPQWSHAVQISCFPATKGGWGFFARLYTGQDYYNIGFLDDITRLHIGATFNQSDFFRFRRRPNVQRDRPSETAGRRN